MVTDTIKESSMEKSSDHMKMVDANSYRALFSRCLLMTKKSTAALNIYWTILSQ